MKSVTIFVLAMFISACTTTHDVKIYKPENSPECTRCDYYYSPKGK